MKTPPTNKYYNEMSYNVIMEIAWVISLLKKKKLYLLFILHQNFDSWDIPMSSLFKKKNDKHEIIDIYL